MNSLACGRLGLVATACLWALLAGGAPANETNVARIPVIRDEAQLLSSNHVAALSKVLEEHNARGPGRIYVVIIKELPDGMTIEKYAAKKGNEPPPVKGEKVDKVLVAIAVKDRKLRIETSKEVWGSLPDSFCKSVIDEMITPKFKQQQYYEGLHAGVTALIAKLRPVGYRLE